MTTESICMTPSTRPLRLPVLTLLLCLGLAACGRNDPALQPPENFPPPADPELAATYAASCGVCHSRPSSGAPQAGHKAAWKPKVARGLDYLLDRTIRGYGSMPPMGLCPQCSEEDFIDLLEYMADTRFD